jgi:DNA-binding GntR family transcriptional regulator
VLPRKGYLIRGLSFSDIHEVMDLRLILEPRLLRVVAANPPPGIVAELRDILKEQFRDGASLDEQLDAATNFHLACMRASRSTRAVSIVSMLTFEIERLHYLFPAVARHVSSETEYAAHSGIIAAIAAGDPDEAEKQMQEHLQESNVAMVRAFSEPGATPGAF